MNYKLEGDGLYCQVDKQWQRVGGWINVLARTRLPNRRHGHGALLEWVNFDGVKLREVVYARDLNSDHSRNIRDMLVDSGYSLTPGQASWSRLQHYLLKQMATALPATVLNRSGWHGDVFATSSGVLGETVEPHYLVGQLSISPQLDASGALEDWQHQVGKLCCGNPLAIFSVGVALAAPLLAVTGMENGAFHLVGASSSGKTTLQRLACSVYGGPEYLRSWVSTENGLEAVAAQHHDMLLALDEIGLARPECVDVAVYQIMNGSGKLRATISGDLASTASWRTLLLSTGEVGIGELLEVIGKQVRAGQQTRLVEIPIFGTFGAFDSIHGRKSPAAFVEDLNSRSSEFFGTLFPAWILLLLQLSDDLRDYLVREVRRVSEHWGADQMASQAQRVTKRFALVAVALRLCSRNFLVPWDEKESLSAVRKALTAWLRNRGHTKNIEEFRLLKVLGSAMLEWERNLVDGQGQQGRMLGVGYRYQVNGRELWLIEKQHFLRKLALPAQHMKEIQVLLQRDCLRTNELARGTYKVKIDGGFQRFFALWPDQVKHLLAEIDGEDDDQ